MMSLKVLVASTALALCGHAQRAIAEEPSPPLAAKVDAAVAQGVEFLRTQQQADGSWSELPGMPGGVTALCTLAMVEGGAPIDDPGVLRAVDFLRRLEPEKTYCRALQTIVYSVVDPKEYAADIARNVAWLEQTQISGGERAGAWGYPRTSGDNSNTQFAVLALRAAADAGATVKAETWRKTAQYFFRTQNADGSWGYQSRMHGSGSMTGAGVMSLVLSVEALGDEPLAADRDASLARAQKWLTDHYDGWRRQNFAIDHPEDTLAPRLLYFLDTLERAQRLSGQKTLGRYDWYADGAAALLAGQHPQTGAWQGSGVGESRPTVATSLAILFFAGQRRGAAVAVSLRPVATMTAH